MLIVRYYLFPTNEDNIVTWDHTVLMAATIVRFEVGFSRLVQAVMHESEIKVTTTYPILCMVFPLCWSTCVHVMHVNQIKTPAGTVDIGLIEDEDNELDHQRGPRPDVPLLGKNLADTVV